MANSIKHAALNLTDEEWDKLETLSALDFSNEKIATYFGINKIVFNQIASDVNSYLAERLEAGKIKQDADERLGLYVLARSGDVPAMKTISEIKRTRAFKISKMDIFGTFSNPKVLRELENYLVSGALIKDIGVEEQLYLDTLIFMRDMDYKYGRRATVEFFVKEYNLSNKRASDMYEEAIALLYGNRALNKKALRHKFAERLELAAALALDSAETPKDLEVVGKLTMQASVLLELDKVDPPKLQSDHYRKQIKVFTLRPESVGIVAANRNELAAEIDALEHSETVKASLKQDAMIDPIFIEERVDKLIENTKNKDGLQTKNKKNR